MSNTANGRAEMYYPDAMSTFKVQPGDTLCIPAGEYEYLHLGNLVGTAAKPIVIINCGGQVKLGVKNQGTAAVFNAPSCRFIEISGSGDKNIEFGFELNGTNITGLKIFGLTLGMGSSDFDVHNLYIHDGNILLQAMPLGQLADLAAFRRVVRSSFPITTYQPRDDAAVRKQWDAAYNRFKDLP